MKVLLTGHDGYIGSVMKPMLVAAGHEVVGVDSFFYTSQLNGRSRKDIRDYELSFLDRFDALIHLAALSNDPLGELNPDLTYTINHKASVRLAKDAKEAGVSRFLYASTCSVYGVSDQEALASEETTLRPLSHYAISKVRVEQDLADLADESFCPVFLRNATAYGWSPNFRSDLVVNNLACWAYTVGEIRILSDGTPWRPVVHVQDIARAFVAALSAPRAVIYNQAINVGQNDENYQVRDIASIVQLSFPECKVVYSETHTPDPRSYRVDFSKIRRLLPAFHPTWSVDQGVKELKTEFEAIALTKEEFTGPKYVRLARLKSLLMQGQLDENLRWQHGSG